MLDVFLCHAPANREVAVTIAARLERGAEANVWLDECGSHSGQTIATAWEAGLTSAAILLVLSPEAVPPRLRREDWQSLLQHLERGAEPPVGAVLVGDCPYPRLLERKHFFHWGDPRQQVLRAIESWIVSLHRPSEQSKFVPARLPWFAGRQGELDTMWQMLVDEAGSLVVANASPASGKTSLAQEFAREACSHFRDILWIECGGRWPASITGELASQLGVTLDGSPADATEVADLIREHRLLVVFDDVTDATPIVAPSPGRGSVLITTRSQGLRLPSHVRALQIENVACAPPVQPASGSVDLKLCQAISVCRPQGFQLSFAAQIANIDEAEAHAACERLVAQRWIDPLDSGRARFRHGAGSMTANQLGADRDALRLRHVEGLNDIFSAWKTNPTRCAEILSELPAGLQCAMHADWSAAVTLAGRAFKFLSAQGRLLEAAEIFARLREAAGERQDSKVVETCTWELSWIQDQGGGIRRPPVGGQLALEFG
jgi:hypothetical protein